MAVDPGFLASISLFQQLDDDERSVLASAMLERAVKPGDVLFKAGDPGDSMFIVHTGQVELFVKDKAGQKIVLHVAEPGEFFGELSLLDGGSRTATGVVVTASELWILDREDLQQLFRKRPDAALDMLAAMGRMTRKANALLQSRVSRNVNEEVEVDRGNIVMRVADWVAAFSGSITFLVLHAILFATWIGFNSTPWAFDPFPYNLLTMTVSLEAIILSTLLLFSGNRSAARDAIRNNIEYEVNLKAELEVAHLHEKNDRMHEEMLERFARIEKALNISTRTSKQVPAAHGDAS
ncbi:MAG: cyclic nucleotide-binding domain-containing protein [Deltaproteobacteria bacterium]